MVRFLLVQGKHSIGVLYYLLARMVLQMRGTVTPSAQWDVMVDLFFYREPEEAKEEEGEQEAAPEQPTYGGSSGFAAPQGTSIWRQSFTRYRGVRWGMWVALYPFAWLEASLLYGKFLVGGMGGHKWLLRIVGWADDCLRRCASNHWGNHLSLLVKVSSQKESWAPCWNVYSLMG